MLKVGDKVAITAWTGTEHRVTGTIQTIVRTTKTLAICDNGRRLDINQEPSSPETIKEAEVVRAERDRKWKEAQEQQAREEADPKYPFLRRFRSGEFECWEKLTLEQLYQIAAWLDEANRK